MRVTYSVGSYNTRRYGKPWIAVVTKWDVGQKPEIRFGASVDNYEAEIEAQAGQIIRYGMKDHRGNGTVNEWAILLRDGSLFASNARDCRDHWLAGCPVINDDGTVADTNVVPLNKGAQ